MFFTVQTQHFPNSGAVLDQWLDTPLSLWICGWQVSGSVGGQIDILGIDSFDNIAKKLDQTIDKDKEGSKLVSESVLS